MAIIIKADYGKKIGLPNYSSHQFNVSITAEVADVTQVKAEAERLYAVLQDSVDSQIVKSGYTPNTGSSEPAEGEPASEGEWAYSKAQKALILDLVVRCKLDKNAVEDLAKARFGSGVKHPNKLKASSLIDELMESHGESRPRFTQPDGSPPQRPNAYSRRAA